MKKIDMMYQTFQGAWAIHGAIGYSKVVELLKEGAK